MKAMGGDIFLKLSIIDAILRENILFVVIGTYYTFYSYFRFDAIPFHSKI